MPSIPNVLIATLFIFSLIGVVKSVQASVSAVQSTRNSVNAVPHADTRLPKQHPQYLSLKTNLPLSRNLRLSTRSACSTGTPVSVDKTSSSSSLDDMLLSIALIRRALNSKPFLGTLTFLYSALRRTNGNMQESSESVAYLYNYHFEVWKRATLFLLQAPVHESDLCNNFAWRASEELRVHLHSDSFFDCFAQLENAESTQFKEVTLPLLSKATAALLQDMQDTLQDLLQQFMKLLPLLRPRLFGMLPSVVNQISPDDATRSLICSTFETVVKELTKLQKRLADTAVDDALPFWNELVKPNENWNIKGLSKVQNIVMSTVPRGNLFKLEKASKVTDLPIMRLLIFVEICLRASTCNIAAQ